jgi:hypothetical protein
MPIQIESRLTSPKQPLSISNGRREPLLACLRQPYRELFTSNAPNLPSCRSSVTRDWLSKRTRNNARAHAEATDGKTNCRGQGMIIMTAMVITRCRLLFQQYEILVMRTIARHGGRIARQTPCKVTARPKAQRQRHTPIGRCRTARKKDFSRQTAPVAAWLPVLRRSQRLLSAPSP